MKKRIAVMLLLISMLCYTVSGCKKEAAPSPDETATQTQRSPSPAPSEKPTESTPVETSTDPVEEPDKVLTPDISGLLETGINYYLEGGSESQYIVFYDDGTIDAVDIDGTTVKLEYTFDGSEISVSGEDGQTTLYIVDPFTLSDEGGYTRFIREGGLGYTGARPLMFQTAHYYLDGEVPGQSLYFYNDGDVDIDSPDSSERGSYTFDGETITITLEGEAAYRLTIYDVCTLINDDGREYYLSDSRDAELETDEYYYYEGMEAAGSLYFYDSGELEITNEDGEVNTVSYVESGSTITITFDGEEVALHIINSYVLENGDGLQFIRIP